MLQYAKKTLRFELRKARQNIGSERRFQAEQEVFKLLIPALSSFSRILSFASLAEEINLWALNQELCSQKKLFLPKIQASGLEIYQISDMNADLERTVFGIKEPKVEVCQKTPLELIDCILVPGLAFDCFHNRLGFGKGHYDRLLVQTNAKKWAIGLKEQLIEDELPREPHDQKVDLLLLF